MEKKQSNTPVIVGSVIAVIGILVGLYFAENANERLAQFNDSTGQDTIPAASQAAATANTESTTAPMPLEPVDIDIPEMEPQQEEPLPQAEETNKDNADAISTPAPPESTAPTPALTGGNDAQSAEPEVDDFVEVDPAEEEQRASQQAKETEQ